MKAVIPCQKAVYLFKLRIKLS